MQNTSLIALTGLTLLLSACGGSSPTIPSAEIAPIVKPAPVVTPVVILPTRPAGSPDYYVVGISGRCFRKEDGSLCVDYIPSPASLKITAQSTENNYNYLMQRGTLPAIVDAVSSKGYNVAYKGFAASLPDRTNMGTGVMAVSEGFISLESQVVDIYNKNIRGFSNPAKIVLVAHSHGTVWSHLLALKHPEIPIEIQVDFDGVCLYWVSDNRNDFASYNYNPGVSLSEVCDGVQGVLNGGAVSDLQNRVFENVKYNVEIQSSDPAFRDSINNAREDGSRRGIVSAKFPEKHSPITMVGSYGLSSAVSSVTILTPRR